MSLLLFEETRPSRASGLAVNRRDSDDPWRVVSSLSLQVALSLINRNALQVIIFCMTELMRQSPALSVGEYPDPIGANIIVLMKRINPIVVLGNSKIVKVNNIL